jgi:sugar phosphate isomerase/epimerase
MMRLGGPLFTEYVDPDGWIAALRRQGYTAAYCPVGSDAGDASLQAYAEAARAAGIVIAEVGAWSNPLSADPETRRAALARCREQLALADRIGARCCVNIAGSRSERWDGPHPQNFSEETFEQIVESVRAVIDAVRPTRTCYTLETMPWIYPDSPDSYLRLIRAIDRQAFGVHLDPVNAKDIALSPRFMVHLDETRPGLGGLDYAVFLRELDRLDADTPLMLEHLATEEEYGLAAGYLRSVAEQEGIVIR